MAEVTINKDEQERVDALPYKLPSKLREILDGFKWAIHSRKQSAVLITDGRSGMGKTTLSFQVAKYITPDFDLKNVFYTPDDFIEALSHTKKGDTLVFDEAMLLSSRAALSAINRMVVIAMSMIRSKNLCIIFNVNSIFDIDRNLALSRADLLLHCYGDSLTDKGKFLAFFKGGDGVDRIKQLYIYGKKHYSYAHPKSNFNSHFPSHFVVDEDEYEKNKQVGVNNFLKGTKSTETGRFVQQRNMLIKIIRDEMQKPYKDMAEMFFQHGLKLSLSQIANICGSKFKNEQEKAKHDGEVSDF